MGDKAKGFIFTTYDILKAGYEEIAWSEDGKTFIIRNPERFALNILPQYFGHSQFASWVRAANAHDFKKTGRKGEWQHPSFLRDRPDLLPTIHRKKAPKPKPKPTPAAPPPEHGEASEGGALSWPMETLTYELELILAEEREGLDFLRAEVTRLEEDKAQLEKERVEDMALAQQLIVVGEYLMSETRALKPLSPTATEFGEKYDCPLKLPGLRMLGTNPQEDEDFNCTHALVKSHGLDRAIALASTPEFASKIAELRAQYEEFCKAYPELELCTSLAGAVTHLTAVLEGSTAQPLLEGP